MKILQSFFNKNEKMDLKKSLAFIKHPFMNFSSGIFNVLYDPNNDYYKILYISDKADLKEIKKTFYKLSLENHPDKGGNEEKFKKINNAYETLKDEQLKKRYDLIRNEYLSAIDLKFNNFSESKFHNKNSNRENKYNSNFHKEANYKTTNSDYRYYYYNSNRNFYKENQYEYNYNGNNENYSSTNYKNNSWNDYESQKNDKYKTNNNDNNNDNKSDFYEYYDFEKEYKNHNEKSKNYFYKYSQSLFNKAKSDFRKQFYKFNEKAEKEETEERRAKIIKDSVNDFNYLNDNMIFSKYDKRTNSYFDAFKVNRLQKPLKEIKFEKYIFKEGNIHFIDNRMKILNEELEDLEKQNFIKRKFKLKLKNNPFEFNSVKFDENSEYNICELMNSKDERDSERIDSRLKLNQFYELMDKKYFIMLFTLIFSINYILFNKSINF